MMLKPLICSFAISGCPEHFLDVQSLHPPDEVHAVDGVAIAEQIPGSRIVGKGVDDLQKGDLGVLRVLRPDSARRRRGRPIRK